MSAVLEATPHYVLMDGKRRIGPSVAQLQTSTECSPIYGSSDKEAETYRAEEMSV